MDAIATNPSILLFPSLSLSFPSASFHALRKTVTGHDNSSLKWLWTTLSNLHTDSEIFLASQPPTLGLKRAQILDQLLDLRDALATGRSLHTPSSERMPNTVLIPLVVASHLAQYVALLEQNAITIEDFVSSGRTRETVGLCTGLLSAFAIASSKSKADLRRNGAAAVRLGMLVGLAVDHGDILRPSKSLSVGWSSAEGREILVRVLKDTPGAYVSVEYDENRTTVTAPVSDLPMLQATLKAKALAVSEISLFGRFHTQENSQVLDRILAFCEKHTEYQLPPTSQVAIPTRGDSVEEGSTTQESLHAQALRSILVGTPTWHKTLGLLLSEKGDDARLLSFGGERCVPASVLRRIGAGRMIHLAGSTPPSTSEGSPIQRGVTHHENTERPWEPSDIAVVGMACKLPGANDVAEFWELLARAESQHQEIGVGHPRFDFGDTAFRSENDPGMRRRWFADLMSDVDQFDHKFFKKSPRESASMDPAQRLILQVAYQAVEQSGYLNAATDRNVGVFLGTTGNDYQANVACQPANSFTTTGNLQGFLAGKVSHQFGWTGPAMVVDTACSGSLVAIHQACTALASGECSAALAGGAHVLTQPAWFQNLAGGQFLSTTGQCKPFDAAADGYCRGEGVGAVFLKRMDRAIAEGDQILGVVAATAVQQNQNCTPIFVPNVPSLGNLFRSVTDKAHVEPSQISVVEAHGTGTAVGDPVEHASIKEVLGGDKRASEKPLVVSSVKGLVGHLEGTSGVVALIKLLLMLHVGQVPPQASFSKMNPAIEASSAAVNMTIPTKLQPWDEDFRIALINNYGASGSNASMVLTQPPTLQEPTEAVIPEEVKFPFWLSAHDDDGLVRRAKALRAYVNRFRGHHSLANLSYNVARQHNRDLNKRALLSVTSFDDLDQKLAKLNRGESRADGDRKIVLCFGGQVSTHVGLDRQLYDSVALLRKYIDRVDLVARSLGVSKIVPSIFQRTPIKDTVLLQVTLFATQYACARCWLDSGVQPAALVGHSFGELTALCISEALSLEDTVRMIINRATAVRDAWGPDKGAMMAVSGADVQDVQKLIQDANDKHNASPVNIACFNGPQSFTLAGSTAGIDAFSEVMANSSIKSIKTKRLEVTNAFHCALVDNIVDKLEHEARGLLFCEPVIRVERATEKPTRLGKLSPKFVPDHMRCPVYFHQAVERVASDFSTSSIVFLEAGSNSTITQMASRALGNVNLKSAHFQPVNITNCEDGWNKLCDATFALWQAGLSIDHWTHHPLQARASTDISMLLLPPYPFDPDSRHWIDLQIPKMPEPTPFPPTLQGKETKEEDTVVLDGYRDGSTQRTPRFRINTSSPKFEKLLSGHMTLRTAPICPATVQIGFVVEGLTSIRPAYAQGHTPQFQDIRYQSPLCANSALDMWIEATEDGNGGSGSQTGGWHFEVFSTSKDSKSKNAKTVYTTGHVMFMTADDASLQRELTYFMRLFGHNRVTNLLTHPDVEEMLTQRNIYRMFAEIVDYGDEYRGVRKFVARSEEAAGVVIPTDEGHTPIDSQRSTFDAHLSDTFCQIAGIWANFCTPRDPSDAYLANGIAQWIRAAPKEKRPAELHVFATTNRSSDKVLLSDVFVFDAADGALLEVILGIAYYQLPKSAMGKVLTRMSDPRWLASDTLANSVSDALEPSKQRDIPATPYPTPVAEKPMLPTQAVKPAPETAPASNDIFERVQGVIADISGLKSEEVKADSALADLGIDSLVGMELINELEAVFEVKLPENEIQAVIDVPGVIHCLFGALGIDSSASVGRSSGTSTPDNETSTGTGRTTPLYSDVLSVEDYASGGDGGKLPFDAVMDAFNEVKVRTDERIADVGQTHYISDALPLQQELTVAHTLEAFEELGAGIRQAQHGQRLTRISHGAEHRQLVTYLYRMLEAVTQTITVNGEDNITRTAVPLPCRSSQEIYQELTTRFPDQQTADKLTDYAGSNLARVLSGTTDGVKLIFGSAKGRELAAGFYGDWPLNRATYAGLDDFFKHLADTCGPRLSVDNPLRILEMGAGTGGTTKRLLPLLAKLGMPVEYTFTDLSPSLVAQARKKWGKEYPFMRFATHDIEKPPAPEFVGTQHLILASNAVHATRSLRDSTQHIHSMLRSDGFLLLVEMTRPMYWVDLVFGLFEGWWMMADGREHVITHEKRWAAEMQASGYGHVNWLDGASEESQIWKLIIAAADPKSRHERVELPGRMSLPIRHKHDTSPEGDDLEEVVAKYVTELTAGWDEPLLVLDSYTRETLVKPNCKHVLITGGTGGLGSHLVARVLARSDESRVICLNRRNNKQDARQRQRISLLEKGTGISLGNVESIMDRIDVIETDLSKPDLGLSKEKYDGLVGTVTHIVHNAWLMHSKWPLKRFEPQLRIMANMISLARDVSARRGPDVRSPVTFEFISSIATVGHHPLWTGQPIVPEERVPIESVLPTGYGYAKYVCERLLDATLHRYPDRFRATTVRLGQIAGSSLNGYWNETEHVSFLVKSSQTLGALPDFQGTLGWTAVDDIAGTLVDILQQPDDAQLHLVYHVENPIRQPWKSMIADLSVMLDIPAVIPFNEWVRRVREWPIKEDNRADGANPACLLVDFLDDNFARMSCGGLLMGTVNAREHSPTLSKAGSISADTTGLYISKWRETGFLK